MNGEPEAGGWIDLAEQNRKRCLRWLEHDEWDYRRTGSPLAALAGYMSARSAGVPIPEWVLAYLDQSAENIWRLTQTPPAEVAPAVAQAFGFVEGGRTGRGSIFSELCNRMWIGHGYFAEREIQRGEKPYLAYSWVASVCGISAATARRAHEKYLVFMKSGLSENKDCSE